MSIYATVFWICVIIGTIGLLIIKWLEYDLELSISNIAKTILFLPMSFILSTFAMMTYGNVILIILFAVIDTIFGTNSIEGAPKAFFK